MILKIVFRKKAICIFLGKKLVFSQFILINRFRFDKSLFLYFYCLLVLYRIGIIK